jgi:sarcosine oxidase subunit beta
MPRAAADVVIVGGGCMGASAAYHLAQLGVTRVVLVEREAALGTGSTGRNAGGVRHQFSHEANVRLSIESIALFEHFEDAVGSPIDFHQDGYLFLLSREAHVAAFREAVAMQRRLGVDVEWLDAAEAARRAPGIWTRGAVAATFCARDGICDPHGVTTGFAGAAQRAGVEIRRHSTVTGIRVERGCVAGVETDAGPIDTRVVVNAAGPWARRIGDMAGVALPIDPLRRHIFLAEPPQTGGWAHGGPGGEAAGPANRVMVIDFESTFYCHREGAHLLFGMSDPEETPGYDITVNWDLLARVAPVAARLVPALADLAIARAWAGLYEMTPDAMPIIGPAGGVDGFHVLAGFSGHGFQHAPAAGRLLADLVAGRDPHFDLAPFAFERFARGGDAGEGNVV